MLLDVKDLTVRFGGIRAVEGVSLCVGTDEVVGIIGPNGAGKTTVLNAISRLVPAHGDVVYADRQISSAQPHQLRALGVARSFQHPQLNPRETIAANIAGGLSHTRGYGWLSACLHGRKMRLRERQIVSDVADLAELFGIHRWLQKYPGHAPYGVHKMADVARACIGSPRLVLLDEPFAGLASEEKNRLTAVLKEVNRRDAGDISVLVIDHDVDHVARMCKRLYAMEIGHLIAEGSPQQVISNPAVIDAYLG